MTEITFLSEPTVELIDSMGSDTSIVRAAQVSLKGANEPDPAKSKGLINYLVRERHGSPFEHTAMTFFVEAPIFVAREFMRHRIASYNEMSGRYTQLQPRFHVPAVDRPLVNGGSSARPEMVPGDQDQIGATQHGLKASYRLAWEVYDALIKKGVANEVAREVLPVGIMTQWYVTMNLRGMFNFLSLRVREPEAAYPSRPQYEIDQVARKIETHVAELFPLAHAAFVTNMRVGP